MAAPIDALGLSLVALKICYYKQGENVSHIKKLEFGNYTLKFGSEKVLLDLFDKVVMPSFLEMKYIRRLEGKCDYFFLDTKLVKLNDDEKNPVIGISGRIVKNTKLKREQIFRPDGGLIEDKSELETAPSSTFLLILNNHRLILCKEVTGGPTIQNFQSTSEYCLKARHKEFINELFDKAKEERAINPNLERITKASLIEESPYPNLRITPLSDKESLKTFVSRFDHIDKISITLLSTNSEEINNDDFWSDLRKKGEEINSISAKVEFSNTKNGLDNGSVFTQAMSASKLGNSEIKLKGYDSQGDTIRGTNEDFSLSVDLVELPKKPEKAATVKYNQFMALAEAGVITLPVVPQSTMDKIKEIFRSI